MPDEDTQKLVSFFSSSNHDAEMEATSIHGVLEADGIPSMLVGPSSIPSLEFQVLVPEDRLADAVQAVAEARASGPEGALEGEMASEV